MCVHKGKAKRISNSLQHDDFEQSVLTPIRVKQHA